MPRRTLKTGYAVSTMRRRLENLADEAELMGQDGRLTGDKASKVRVCILMALKELM